MDNEPSAPQSQSSDAALTSSAVIRDQFASTLGSISAVDLAKALAATNRAQDLAKAFSAVVRAADVGKLFAASFQRINVTAGIAASLRASQIDNINRFTEAFRVDPTKLAAAVTLPWKDLSLWANWRTAFRFPDFGALERLQARLREAGEGAAALEAAEFELVVADDLCTIPMALSFARVDARVREAVITNAYLTVTRGADFEARLRRLLQRSPRLRRRSATLLRAIQAHRERDYLVSVHLLLPEVEAVFTEVLRRHRLVTARGRKLYAIHADGRPRLDRRNNQIELMSLHRKVDHFKVAGPLRIRERDRLKTVLETTFDRWIPERDAILHGAKAKYGTAKRSTQLLLLLYVLAKDL